MRTVGERIQAIADDCFDLRTAERLRLLAEDIARTTSLPPIILARPGEARGSTGNR
jgi:hypothetical protein